MPWPPHPAQPKLEGEPPVAATRPTLGKPFPLFIRIWFLADALVALTPQVHFAASGATPVLLGLPRVIAYLLVASAFVSASVVAAYLCDPARRA